MKAHKILKVGVSTLFDRSADRDVQQERSMRKTVEIFNTLKGTCLTEHDGWEFMVILKLVRANAGAFRLDDYVDMACYAALTAESKMANAG